MKKKLSKAERRELASNVVRHRISQSRAEYIKKNFFEWSFNKQDDFIPNKSKFELLNHPAELHYLVNIYNWDDGISILEWVLESPFCSKATTNLLFWRSAPDYYLKYCLENLSDCPDYDREVLILIKKCIEKHNNNNFSKIDISYDPKYDAEEITTINKQWEIPKFFYEKSNGISIAN